MMTECIALVSWRELTRALLHLRRYLVDRGYWISRPRTVLHRRHLLCLGIHDHDASYTRYYRQVDPGNVTNTWLFDSWWVQHNRTEQESQLRPCQQSELNRVHDCRVSKYGD